MSYFQIIAIFSVLAFSAWLIFSKTKKLKRAKYTENDNRYKLYNNEKMLENITQKSQVTNMKQAEEPQIDEPLPDEKNQKTEHRKNNQNKTKENKNFDPKQAVIASNIIERKKK